MSPKVKVIVMITRLVEGEGSKRRKKADCYWPDRKVIMVELGMMVLAMAFVMMVLVDMQYTWKCY